MGPLLLSGWRNLRPRRQPARTGLSSIRKDRGRRGPTGDQRAPCRRAACRRGAL